MNLNATYLGTVVELDDKSPRVKIQALRTGKWKHPSAPNKELNITEELLDTFVDNFKNGIRGKELPTNENHADSSFTRSPAWIVDFERKPGELHAIVEVCDEDLLKDIRSGKVKYFSPEIQFGWTNPEDGKNYDVIKGAAWTNIPYIKRMEPAQILNLSEMVDNDEELKREMDSEPYTLFKKTLEAMEEDLKSHGVFDDCGYKFDHEQIEERLGKLKGAGKSNFSVRWNELSLMLNELFLRMRDKGGEHAVIANEHESRLREALNKILEPTYDDGPNLAESSHGAGKDDRQFPNDAKGDEEPDRNNVDSKEHPESSANDPDAENPELPAQCGSCKKLDEGSCPFQGIQVKLAAAGEGNCPQFISTQAQIAPQTDDAGTGSEARGGSGVNFNEETRMENVNLEEFQALQGQVATLSETVKNLATENSSLRESLTLSETQRLQSEARSFVDGYLTKGKITPKQGEIVLNILAIERGEEVKLSDDSTATVATLLGELLESNEIQVPLDEASTKPVKKPVDTANLTEHEKLYTSMETRAKEIALSEGGDWKSFMSRAAREVSAEHSRKNGGK